MKAIQVIFCVCILFVIMSCAHKPTDVQFCDNQKCAALTEADSKEVLLPKLAAMIKANLNKKVPLLVSSEKGGKADKDIVLEWKGGDTLTQPRSVRINSLTFTDILSIDQENREIKVMAQFDYFQRDAWSSGVGIKPEGSYTVQMPCSITVRSSKEISFQGKTKLWAYNFWFDGLIDHIDTDRVFWGCPFATGLIYTGQSPVKEGYLQLAF